MSKHSDNEYYCPFSKEPREDCYCNSTRSMNASLVIHYCGGNFDGCQIYKKIIKDMGKSKNLKIEEEIK